MWVIALHFGAGAVTGAMFTMRTLLALVMINLVECVAAWLIGGLAAGLYSIAGLFAVQIGYLAGGFLRSALERAGIAHPVHPPVRAGHQR